LNTAREGAATASLGNLFQDLTSLRVKNFFLISNLNQPSFNLKPLPLALSPQALVKSPSPALCCISIILTMTQNDYQQDKKKKASIER